MRINIFFFLLLCIIIIPSAYFLYIENISYSSGTTITIALIIIIYFIKNKKITIDNSVFTFFIFLTIIFLNSIYSMLFFDWFDFRRFILSFILISALILASNLFVKFSERTDDNKIHKYINIVFYISIIDCIIFFFKKKFFFPRSSELFLFPEMSHFALIFLPLLCFKILTYKKEFNKYILIIFSLSLAIFVENLTLLIGTILVMAVYSLKKTLFSILTPLLLIIFFAGIENFNYFTDRMTFTNPNNISTLVFLSGWERAYLNLFDYNFLGIGLNQLGLEGQMGTYHEKIKFLGLPELNLKDGGSVAPKLISELGVLGIILICIYLFFFFKIIYNIKKTNLKFNYLSTFYLSIYIMFFVNLFLRGTGYFSPIIFLFFSSIFYLMRFNFFNDSHSVKRKILKE
jgi:hypothetical protein